MAPRKRQDTGRSRSTRTGPPESLRRIWPELDGDLDLEEVLEEERWVVPPPGA